MRWAAISAPIAAERLVVVLEALQQVLDAGMALGVDGGHGAVDDGRKRDGFGVGGHARRVPAWPRAKRLACGHGHHRRTGHGRHGRSDGAQPRARRPRGPRLEPQPRQGRRPARRRRRRARRSRGRGGGRRRRADHARRRRRGPRRRAAGEPRRGADLVAGVHHRARGDRAVRGAGRGDRCGARRRAGARHQAAGRGGQARGPGLRPGLRARRVRAALRHGRAADHAARGGGHRDAAQARGQPVGPGRDAGHRRDDRLRPVAGSRSPSGSSTRWRAARSTCPTSA